MANGLVYINTAVDPETGEIKQKNVQRKVYFDEQNGYLFFSQKNGARTFDGIDLPDTLTDFDIAKLYRLSRRIYRNSNLLTYRTGNNIKPMQIMQIARLLHMSERCAVIFVNKMIRMRILAKAVIDIGSEKQVQYYMNPIYFFNGKWLSLNLYLLFKVDLDGVLPDWVRQKFNDVELGKSN